MLRGGGLVLGVSYKILGSLRDFGLDEWNLVI